MTPYEMEDLELVMQTGLHHARDALRRALDQCEDSTVTEEGVAYIQAQIIAADNIIETLRRQTETLRVAIIAARRKQQASVIA